VESLLDWILLDTISVSVVEAVVEVVLELVASLSAHSKELSQLSTTALRLTNYAVV
jgi:hypothetical protein